MPIGDWEGTDSDLARYLLDSNERSLQSYQSKPEWIEEHARIEQGIAEGGYGHRQVYELVQNGADAMVHRSGGRIEVILTDTHLYCANEGDPIDRPGLEALLASNMSRKRGDEIGRFGLGFKSVLAVTDTPEFFSKPVTLRFSREFSEAQIISRIPAARGIPLPILRLGQPLDVATEAQSDPVLAELIDWSATVVRLRREPARDTSWLTTDLTDFPAEFLLFTRHVSRLVLDDRTSGLTRTITVQRGGDEVRLVEGQRDQRWQVFQKVVEPTREARIDGGVRAERDRLPIDWAVPTSGPSAIGKFWAFFPTTFETTLSGILNAPWKTNPDRENLLVGAFNEFLIDAATELVVDKLQQVTSMDDPGRHLDRMPARGREARTWADRRITAGVYELAAQRASLPDQRGQLTFPKDLRLHPERIPTEALELWCSFPFRPHQWVHPSVETRDRRPRVERLLETARRDGDDESVAIANYREWLEALAAPGSAEASAAALAVARLLQAHLSPVDFNEVKQAHIVLSAPGQLVAADPSRVFIGGHPDVAGTVAVHPGLLKDTFAEQTLRDTFGIVDVDRFAEFAAYVATAVDDNAYWDGLWERAELLPADEAADVILRYHRSGDVQIRTIAGSFRPMHSVLLTGPVVHADADADHTIDEGWHSTTLALLKALGATDVPRPDREGFADPPPWFSDYLDAVRIAFKAEGQTVRANTAVESDHTGIPTHIEMLASLSEEARARLTAELIRLPTTRQSWSWRAGGGHQHPSLEFPSPAAWMVKHHGTLLTTQGPRPVPTAVSASLTAFGRLLPVSRLSAEVTSILELPENVGDTPTAVLNEAMGLLADETDDDLIGRFISAVADLLAAPESLRCRVGRAHRNCPPTEVTAMVSSELTPQLRKIDTPIVVVPHEDDVERLAKRWGLRRTGDLVTQEIGFQLSSAEVPLIDEFPNLRLLLTDAHRKATLLRCTELTLTTRAAGGQTTDARDRIFDGARVYWLIHDLADPHREDAQLLNYISEQLQLKLTDTQIAALVKNREDEEQRRLRQLIRHQTNDVDRLLTCLGADVLRRYVPSSLIDAAQEQGHEPDDRTLAEMALAVHGVEILREARGDLEDRRLQPPSQWAGGRAAQEFVRDLGFGREYAGFQEDRRDQILEVIGPVDLKELHDFQAVVKDRFRDLLRTTGAMKRAMLSLPTGAGKTRVAVQSLVEHFAAGEIGGPVLWVAQSEELCEQAVQAWAEVWRAMGPSQALTISRLWDANSAEPVDGAPQVVVATIQKLDASVVEQPRYGWLAEAAVVVVDEAHRGATTPTTTRLFQWLGLETRGIDRCPLVGLTATPFIGTNVEQGKILARRYGKKRLDTGLFPEGNTERLIALLQQRRILSRVDHRTLEGVDIDLDENEMDELNTFQRLPRAVEARLGVNADRNRTLVKSIREHPTDWQILLFSASVEHARTLAALLRLEGITAAAITGETRPGARRHYVQQFKDRKIRVLTNYGTLTTGFDAPEVRAVYIARPTYSPNLYLQMIGRGLRGPINGGTEQCLIVDVKDNVQMYGGKLAFTDFEYLWEPDAVA